jgi:beta-N-acetylhexosaminidase
MLILGFPNSVVNHNDLIAHEIAELKIGGVILFDVDFYTRKNKNIINQAQLRALNTQLNQYNQSDIPLFISVDCEGGIVNRLKKLDNFSSLISAVDASKMTFGQLKIYTEQLANNLKDLGFNLDFAPVVDVNTNTDNPIIGKLNRSFSADPKVVKQYAEIYINSFLENKILGCYKHFPGHGSSTGDSHLGLVDVTDTWHIDELIPYHNITKPMAIMTAHVINNNLDASGVPASLSKKILTSLLKQELKFNGILISDDLQMQAITDQFSKEEAVVKAINAGCDMVIYGNQLAKERDNAQEIINIIHSNVQNNNISVARIDDAYNRIINIKKLLSPTLKI